MASLSDPPSVLVFCRYFRSGMITAESVGPACPGTRGSRLVPERLNTIVGLVSSGTSTPKNTALISSQFCSPFTTSFVGSGFMGLFSELS